MTNSYSSKNTMREENAEPQHGRNYLSHAWPQRTDCRAETGLLQISEEETDHPVFKKGKDLNRHFAKQGTHVANKELRKRRSTPWVIRKIHIKRQCGGHICSMAKIRKPNNAKCGKRYEATSTLPSRQWARTRMSLKSDCCINVENASIMWPSIVTPGYTLRERHVPSILLIHSSDALESCHGTDWPRTEQSLPRRTQSPREAPVAVSSPHQCTACILCVPVNDPSVHVVSLTP